MYESQKTRLVCRIKSFFLAVKSSGFNTAAGSIEVTGGETEQYKHMHPFTFLKTYQASDPSILTIYSTLNHSGGKVNGEMWIKIQVKCICRCAEINAPMFSFRVFIDTRILTLLDKVQTVRALRL